MSYAGLLSRINARYADDETTFAAEDFTDLDTGRRLLAVAVDTTIAGKRWRQEVKATMPQGRGELQRVLLDSIRLLLGEVKARRQGDE